VQIANRSDGGVLHWLIKLYGFAACVVVVTLVVTTISIYSYFAKQAPPAPDLRQYARIVPGVSRVYAGDGTLLGEFAEEWRELAPYDQIPERLVQAFLAIEDHRFFEHHGIDAMGIARAAWRNITAGDFAQGGSTITQQVAKQFLGSEKSLTRKAKEAIMARRLEARYSKQAILAVYLNEIYLGFGAYGVRAAAHRYFGKELAELDLGEMATIAGLAQAPSRYSPVTNKKLAEARRNVVLDAMSEQGFISNDEADQWKQTSLVLRPLRDRFGTIMPYYAEHLRRYVVDKYGSEQLMTGGLTVEAAADPAAEAAAYDSAIFGARKQDKRQGWRGPEAHLDGQGLAVFKERAATLYGDGPLEPGRRYLALVEEVDGRGAKVLVGSRTYDLPLRLMDWASKWQVSPAINDEILTNPRQALGAGDVIWVKKPMPLTERHKDWFLAEGVNPRWRGALDEERARRFLEENADNVELEQVSHPQTAIFTGDLNTQYAVAVVGGTDYARSEYNRAIQACRQPGSTYKPIYYSAALDEGYGFDTSLNDIPRAEVDPDTGEIWVPENFGGTVDNSVTLEYALVFSKNVPSVDIFSKVGAKNVEAWARRLGFTTTIIADKALALGASCTVLPELTGAFAVFARNGKATKWNYVRRVLDRGGNLIEDNTVYFDPELPPRDQLDRLAATAGIQEPQAIPARTGYLTSKLLSQTIKFGFASIIRATGVNAAGKTGTSSATMDTSFVGYTSRWITTVWLGDDLRERPLGIKDAAYMTVVPMWARYMAEATVGHPNLEIPWEVPEGVRKNDRGGSKGVTGGPMPLIYKKHVKPGEVEG